MEQKESDAVEKAGKLIARFEKSFLGVRSTFHPPGIQGEIAGKSSNVAFAARHIVQVHRAELSAGICNVLVTVMDADTHLWQDYFTELRRLHNTHPPQHRRPNPLHLPHHLRPQRPRIPYTSPLRRPPLGLRRPLNHVPRHAHLHPDIRVLAAAVAGGTGWRMG